MVPVGTPRFGWPPEAGRRSSDRLLLSHKGCLRARSRSASSWTRMVEGTVGSHHKEGSTKMSKTSTIVAGIDVAKAHLDIAIHGCKQSWQMANTPEGLRDLTRLMRRHQVTRIGLEATGGYERDVVEHLRATG